MPRSHNLNLSRPPNSWRNILLISIWGAALYGVLQLQHVSLGFGHALCGAWGCGPPLAPLIATHGFWLIFLAPGAVKMCRQLSTAVVRIVGQALLWIGLTGFAVVGLWEAIPALPHWLPRVQGLAISEYAPRFFLSVVTLVEVPLIEVTIIGLFMLAVAQSQSLATASHFQQTQSAPPGATPLSVQQSPHP